MSSVNITGVVKDTLGNPQKNVPIKFRLMGPSNVLLNTSGYSILNEGTVYTDDLGALPAITLPSNEEVDSASNISGSYYKAYIDGGPLVWTFRILNSDANVTFGDGDKTYPSSGTGVENWPTNLNDSANIFYWQGTDWSSQVGSKFVGGVLQKPPDPAQSVSLTANSITPIPYTKINSLVKAGELYRLSLSFLMTNKTSGAIDEYASGSDGGLSGLYFMSSTDKGVTWSGPSEAGATYFITQTAFFQTAGPRINFIKIEEDADLTFACGIRNSTAKTISILSLSFVVERI